MVEIDVMMLIVMFIASLISSIVGGCIASKFKQPSNTEYNCNETSLQTSNKINNSNDNLSSISEIPIAICRPISNKPFMDGKWEDDIYRQNLFEYTLDKFSFNQLQVLLPFHTNTRLQLLMQLIPCLSQDTIEIISSFLAEIDLCISKYTSVDYTHKYIQFYINDLDFKQIKKTIKIPINTQTVFTQQILHTIQLHYATQIQTDKPALCSVYFHNNYNALVSGNQFILSVLPHPKEHGLKFSAEHQILCEFGADNYIHFVTIVNKDLVSVGSDWPCYGRNLMTKFDGKYVCGVQLNDENFFLCSYDQKLKICGTIPASRAIPDSIYNNSSILWLQLCDGYMVSSLGLDRFCDYLMILRQTNAEIQLFSIRNHSFLLYDAFDLTNILREISVDYFNKNTLNDRNYLNRNNFNANNAHMFDGCILGFEVNDNGTLFCLYFDRCYRRLFAANIRLSVIKDMELINYTLLDGIIDNINTTLLNNMALAFIYRYEKCLGIEAIHTNEGMDWLVFCQLYHNELNSFDETEFRLDSTTLKVKYGRKRYWQSHKSQNRKQLSFSKFM